MKHKRRKLLQERLLKEGEFGEDLELKDIY